MAKAKEEVRLPEKIQPARANEIQYKAFTRQFELGTLLFLTATCSYPVGPYEIYFQGEGGFSWVLMEKAPVIFYPMVTYHIASTTTGLPPVIMPSTITVRDGFGSHKVTVEKGNKG
jgi:hypothetical protein